MYRRILALFSSEPYVSPEEIGDHSQLARHLTNTSLQTHRGEEGVRLFSELQGCRILSGRNKHAVLDEAAIEEICKQMTCILAEVFRAAIAQPVHFQVSHLR